MILLNCVAAVWRTVFQNTFCVRRGLGRSLNKQKNHLCRESGFGWFLVFVATHALLANLQCVKHKHCLPILFLQKFDLVCAFLCKKECSDLVVSKTGKQGIWRAICEKTPFPISSEAVFLACWVASQSLNAAKFCRLRLLRMLWSIAFYPLRKWLYYVK